MTGLEYVDILASKTAPEGELAAELCALIYRYDKVAGRFEMRLNKLRKEFWRPLKTIKPA